MTIFSVAATNLIAVTRNSLPTIIKTKNRDQRGSISNVNNVIITPIIKILSIKASMKVPRVEIILRVLAKYPSSQSVTPHNMNSTRLNVAHHRILSFDMYMNATTRKSNGIRSNVTQLAKFIHY